VSSASTAASSGGQELLFAVGLAGGRGLRLATAPGFAVLDRVLDLGPPRLLDQHDHVLLLRL